MSWDEHIMLIAHTVNCFGDKLIVVGNTGSNSTREAIHATEQGFAVGMHAALSINPYYGKTSKRGVMEHFNACLNEGPAIIYNVPGRTGASRRQTSQPISLPKLHLLSFFKRAASKSDSLNDAPNFEQRGVPSQARTLPPTWWRLWRSTRISSA